MKYNATSLLGKSEGGFLSKITPDQSQENELKSYRKDVRHAIRTTFSDLREAFSEYSRGMWQLDERKLPQPLVELFRKLSPQQRASFVGVRPKFMSQGSFVYKTLNLPCHNPPQQIDLDDGVYLPLEMFKDKPVISKEFFFAIVDFSLSELARRRHWQFEEKNTCGRLVVNRLIHIDVPLYAIPTERFVALESLQAESAINEWFTDSRSLLSKNDIYLAVRDRESWINSDPATISEWFKESVRYHGEPLRNVCRHLKAWRDYHFPKKGPSSIALMACVVETFSEAVNERGSKFKGKQESEALALCAKKLEQQLSKGVLNPIDPSKPELYSPSSLNELDFETDKRKAAEFGESLDFAFKRAKTRQDSVDTLRVVFGLRVPNRVDLVEISSDSVLGRPAKETPAPVVPNADAG
ncbi:CBASS cGAMP synthase [Vibrio splendidus]|uniref:CBASS cGAMP synthase n=1 Tax=Vibrio splendidus TaxID=29497 RepID=UPI0022363E44|nr:CBASS cGAMP synthase [Vibrio splendidus]MCW4446283.1 CBASS cGAMP synthase [Vibrio splendidus]